MSKLTEAIQSTIQTRLYPYQREDVEWIIQHPRCIVGSMMGLGKSIEAMAVADKLQTRHNLIVCKKTMVSSTLDKIGG